MNDPLSEILEQARWPEIGGDAMRELQERWETLSERRHARMRVQWMAAAAAASVVLVIGIWGMWNRPVGKTIVMKTPTELTPVRLVQSRAPNAAERVVAYSMIRKSPTTRRTKAPGVETQVA